MICGSTPLYLTGALVAINAYQVIVCRRFLVKNTLTGLSSLDYFYAWGDLRGSTPLYLTGALVAINAYQVIVYRRFLVINILTGLSSLDYFTQLTTTREDSP